MEQSTSGNSNNNNNRNGNKNGGSIDNNYDNNYGNNSNNKNKNKNVNLSFDLIDEIRQLKSRCYESELENEGLNSLIETLKSKIRNLQQQILSQESSIQLTQDLISQKEILLEQIERYKQKSNDFDLQLNLTKKELNSLKEDNIDYVKRYNELQQKNVQLQQLNNLLELDKQQLNNRLKEADQEKILLQKELRQCNEQLNLIEKNKNEFKSYLEKLDSEHRKSQCKVSEFELEIETLQREVKRLREKCVSQYHEIDESTKLNDKLKNDINILQRVIVEQDRTLRERNQQENGTHPAYCNVCNKYIVGVRYKCGHCDNYDICSNCETANHNRNHVFIKIKRPIDNDRFVKTALLPEFQLIEQNEQDIHHKVNCSVCHKSIQGVRYKCGHCAKFELCVNCEAYPFNLHDTTHVFVKIKRPVQIDSNEPLLPLEFRPTITKSSNM